MTSKVGCTESPKEYSKRCTYSKSDKDKKLINTNRAANTTENEES